jgi:cobalt-zinc-cadmium efflux system outer membrane protein
MTLRPPAVRQRTGILGSSRRAARGAARCTILAIGCVVSLLVSCAPPQPVELSAADAAAQFRTRRLDDEGLRQLAALPAAGLPSWPPAALDARALDLAAVYFSPALQVARARWQVAEAAIVTADQIPNPTFNLSPLYVTNAVAGEVPWFLATGLVQIIETAGKRGARVARAKYLAEAARLDALNLAWETIGRVNGALVDLAAARMRMAAIDRQVAAQSELSDVAEKRLYAGLGTRLELLAARTALNRALLDRQAAGTALTEAHHRLAQAAGVPVDALPLDRIAAEDLGAPLTADFEKRIRQQAPLSRADLLARLADYAASDTALQVELANRYPNPELGPAFEYDKGAQQWGLALTVAVPIFNQNQGPIAEASARRRQAADEFVALQASVIGDIDRAIAAYDSAARSFAVADAVATRQRARLRAQEALFAQGETDRLELLAARVEQANTEVLRADARAALAKARLAVELAGHRLFSGFDPAPLALQDRS